MTTQPTRYEFCDATGFLMDTRENLIDAKMHGIGLANDLRRKITVVRVTYTDYGQPRYKNVAVYRPTH